MRRPVRKVGKRALQHETVKGEYQAMPELPEVETVRRGLDPVMTGHTIDKAEVNRPDLRWPFPANMAERLTGASIKQLRRRSKYLLADLSTGETLLIHLGMSGRMVVSGHPIGEFHHDREPTAKHDHVVFHMSNGARVTFNDARRFGCMDLFPTENGDDHPLLASLGPEPLGNQFDGLYLKARLKGKAAPIKSALLDQRLVAGLGNIYVCESLFRSGISPKRQAGRISGQRVERLFTNVQDVLREAIEAGGSSLRDYRQADGELGYFQHSFQVYDREGCDCLNTGCDAKIVRVVQSGRSSFYCPKCQQ